MSNTFCITVLALAALGSPAAQAQRSKPAPPANGNLKFCPGSGLPCVEISQEAFNKGHQQFVQSCGFCHGPNAAGASDGPNLIRSALVRHDVDGNDIGKVIREGRPDKGMPHIPLSNEQIASVVGYLHARLAEADKTSARRPGGDLETKHLLTGNAESGKAYFNGPGECASCHSPSGDLKGIASKYSGVDLQARFLYPSGKRPTATVTESSGKQFTGQLLQNDRFDVAIKDKQGWYHSWPANAVKVEVHDPLARHLELLSKFTTPDMHNVFAYLETLK